MMTPGLFLTDHAAYDSAAAAAVVSLAQGLARTACIARALVQHGRTVDLAGFENGAGLLIAKALDLPPESGRTVLADLLALRDEVDLLTAAIRGDPLS